MPLSIQVAPVVGDDTPVPDVVKGVGLCGCTCLDRRRSAQVVRRREGG
eukprot:CAMPEP_0180826520 /NCGR_PEP_ID=MMETSP1038_2-20121128/73589_1 /TAXON_ID=632150 /ORGANISM="Azadinium spinosum, Strain 3D9" /LENGTH=47 /DNA_ID= /DNA_START= /DNA_END= /DNA_ORIENTATION=